MQLILFKSSSFSQKMHFSAPMSLYKKKNYHEKLFLYSMSSQKNIHTPSLVFAINKQIRNFHGTELLSSLPCNNNKVKIAVFGEA